MIYHLSPKGIMACVLANGSLSSQSGGEGEIRKALVENDLVDCIVALPKQLFYNTGIPACIWFISRKRTGNGDRKRSGEILFIDAGEVGYMKDRTHRAFTEEDIAQIAETYHQWRKTGGTYQDIKGFCKSANMEEIAKHNFVLTPGRYVGIKDQEEDAEPFPEKMARLTGELARQMEESVRLDKLIWENLEKIGVAPPKNGG